MSTIIWNDDYSVGVEKLDTDHIILFSLINYLNAARIWGSDNNIIKPLLDALTYYVDTHFRREEAMMKSAGLDDAQFELHVEEHRQFEKRVLEMKDEFIASADADLGRELGDFLSHWLVDHILDIDMRYKGAIKDKWNEGNNQGLG